MLEKSERVLKIICLGMAALLVADLVIAVFKHNPLEHANVPTMPSLPVPVDATNAPAAKANVKSGSSTNAASGDNKSTNAISVVSSNKVATNVVATAKEDTNAVAAKEPEKNGTNGVASVTSEEKGTNAVAATNVVVVTNAVSGTNRIANAKPGKKPIMAMAGGRPGKGKPAVELPPVVQARVDKIVDSEILGQVQRPVPMGLLGIAGDYAFLRAPSGQAGMVKLGDEMGGIKLVKIGINRVLVEEDGEKKELVIFDGYGGETLLPKSTDKPNEIIKKPKE